MTYDPNQPRVGKGHPDGGQWTKDGGGAAKSARKAAELKTPMEFFEDKNRRLTYERLGGFDLTGELFFTKNGTEDRIVLDAYEAMQLRGAHVVHNHPSKGVPGTYLLSPGDIYSTLANGYKSIKAYNEYGWSKITLNMDYIQREARARFLSAEMFGDFFARVMGQIQNEKFSKYGSPLSYEQVEDSIIQTYKRAALYYDFEFDYEKYK